MKRKVTGSCHCGNVRFSCDMELSQPTLRCNCSICAKARYWFAPVPAADFQLLQGGDALAEYRFAPGQIAHRFCRRCGIKVFGEASLPVFGGPFYAVNVASLDLSPEALASLPISYLDGLHDAPQRAPAVTSHL
jgi:hypothetical protein